MPNSVSTFDKIKLVFAAIGGMAGGIFIAYGPADLRQEIPFHFELGMGFVVFGLLMLAALFSVRAKSLLLSIATGLFAAGCIFVVQATDYTMWQFYIYSALALLFGGWAIFCLYTFFSGEDPAE